VHEERTQVFGFACEACSVGWTSTDVEDCLCWRCGQPAKPRPGYVIVSLERDE